MPGLAALVHPGAVVDVWGRPHFSRFDPPPGRPHFSNFGPPAEQIPVWGGLRCAEPTYFSRVAGPGGRLSRFGAHLPPGAL